MVITSHEKYALKKVVSDLRPRRGRHTELVSVYVPEGYELVKIIQHLQEEQGTATNIKSASTRNNVLDALERMIQHLRLINKTPKHGLACFSGNVSEQEGKSDVRVWSVEPPIPLKIRLYRCDKSFVLEPLEEMLDTDDIYGLVVMDKREATLGFLKGKAIMVIDKDRSAVPGKFKAGGQSAYRFAQNRELAAREFYKKIAEMMKNHFLTKENLKGILVGGPGPTKYELVEGGFITGDVQKKILAVKDIGYTDSFGLGELVDRSQDILAETELAEEKNLVSRFLEFLAKDAELVAYGAADVKAALEAGAVDILMLSEQLDEKVLEDFEAIAQRFGTTVKIISTDTREGVQLRDIGKVGAILRYKWKPL